VGRGRGGWYFLGEAYGGAMFEEDGRAMSWGRPSTGGDEFPRVWWGRINCLWGSAQLSYARTAQRAVPTRSYAKRAVPTWNFVRNLLGFRC
jgi:hypothetical protein